MKSRAFASQLLTFSFITLLTVLFLPVSALAQSTTDGAIGGTVYDPSGAVVPNVAITVHNNGTNAEQTVVSDATGAYRVIHLAPAIYTVTMSCPGFSDFKAENFIVEVGSVTELSPHLAVSGTTTEVQITAESPQINFTSADFAPVVNQTAVSNLPINGGRWSSFALLTPGVLNDSSGFGLISVKGMSTLLNNNTVDGADNNQAFFSEERGRTRAGYSSPKAAVQEFQVNTSNYSAEYGRAAGGVINTVTKSGSNQFHGEVYFYDRDNDWGATNPFTTLTVNQGGTFVTTPYKPVDERKIYGFQVGGPILKDRLFFSFAFDRYDKNYPGTAKAGSPAVFFAAPTAASINTLAQRENNLFPNQAPTPAQLAQAATDYSNGLNGLLSETGAVPRKGQAT